MSDIGYNFTDFNIDFEIFKLGRKVKKFRDISKKDFSKKTGLSIQKITKIEEMCYNAKLKDLMIYCQKGGGKSLDFKIEF